MICPLNPRDAPVGRVRSREGFQQRLPTKRSELLKMACQNMQVQLNNTKKGKNVDLRVEKWANKVLNC